MILSIRTFFKAKNNILYILNIKVNSYLWEKSCYPLHKSQEEKLFLQFFKKKKIEPQFKKLSHQASTYYVNIGLNFYYLNILITKFTLREKCPNADIFLVLKYGNLIYSLNLRIQPEYWKIQTRKNSVFRHFSAVVYRRKRNNKAVHSGYDEGSMCGCAILVNHFKF